MNIVNLVYDWTVMCEQIIVFWKLSNFDLGSDFLVFGYGDELVNLLKPKFGVEKHNLVMGLHVILNNTQLITNVTTLTT